MSLVGCRPLLTGKQLWLIPWVLEGGSVLVQVPTLLSPSCAGAWLFPCRAADELAPPTGLQRHCNGKEKPFVSHIRWRVWLKKKVKVFKGWHLLLEGVLAGGRDNAVHGENCWQEMGFMGFFAEDWSWKRARLGHLHHQTDVNNCLNFETRSHRHQRIFTRI